MPRHQRIFSESGIYHVMLRGIDRNTIFHHNEDYQKFLGILHEESQRDDGTRGTGGRFLCPEDRGTVPLSPIRLFAYCLMSNHVHILLYADSSLLSSFFKRVGVRYVQWYNTKYQRTGPLFQDRFKSEPVENDAYFITVLRYIYQNPVKAGLASDIGNYPWSSYHKIVPNENWPLDLSVDWERFWRESNQETCLEMTCPRPNDQEAEKIICDIANLSIRQISRLTGLSKRLIEDCGT